MYAASRWRKLATHSIHIDTAHGDFAPIPELARAAFAAAADVGWGHRHPGGRVSIYQFLMIVRGRRSAHILTGVAMVLVTYLVSIYLGLELLRQILVSMAPYAPVALIVMFQSELRRLMARIGRRRFFTLGSRLQRREFA